jgi:hypothetical protein
MELDKLLTLKEMMLATEDFNDAWEFFFKAFTGNETFIEQSIKTEAPLLETILDKIGKTLFGNESMLSDLILLKIPQYNFIHGVCLIHGRPASLIFFEDSDIGLISVIKSITNHEMSLVRFSTIKIENSGNPLFTGIKSKQIH